MLELQDKIALVTGGSRGIGAAVCLALAKAGVHVAVNYRARRDAAEKVCSEIQAFGRRAIPVQANASQSAAVKEMLSRVESEFGSVSILVNNSGIARPQKVEDISEAEWDELIDVNLKSAFLVTQAVLPQNALRAWGKNHQHFFGCSAGWRGRWPALCGIEGGNDWTDAFLRESAR